MLRAGCCWPLKPESEEIIDQIFGAHCNLPQKSKTFKVREKLKKSNFLQTSTEDFLSCQNLDRKLQMMINDSGLKVLEVLDITDQEE